MKGLIFFTMLFCINGAFAAPTKSVIRIMCDIKGLTTEQQKVECPKLIEKVLSRMGCGGEVSSCRLTSPGSPKSGEVCSVTNSQCTEPAVLESNYYKPACKRSQSDKYFRDFDDVGANNGPLHLERIYDMGVNIQFVCL